MRKSMSDRQKTKRQSVYHRGNQRDSSPNYVLLYSDDDYSDEENIPLKPRTHVHPPRKVEVINIQLQPEDTLQGLALRYQCTISELKRINKIHNDNEIFARPSIKVPVQPFSLLTENLITLQEDGANNIARQVEDPSAAKEEQILHLITNPVAILPQSTQINNIILNSVIEPITKTDENEENTCNDTLLSPSERQVKLETDLTSQMSCSGADWGLKWRHVLGISLLFGIVVPIMYIFQKTKI